MGKAVLKFWQPCPKKYTVVQGDVIHSWAVVQRSVNRKQAPGGEVALEGRRVTQLHAVGKGAYLQNCSMGCLGELSAVKLSLCPQRLLTAGVQGVAGPIV